MANAPFRIRGGALVEGQMTVSAPPTETSHVVTLGYLDSVLPEETEDVQLFPSKGQVLMGNGMFLDPDFNYVIQELNIVETKTEREDLMNINHLEALMMSYKRWYGVGINTVGDVKDTKDFAPSIINQNNDETRRVKYSLSPSPMNFNFFLVDDYSTNYYLNATVGGMVGSTNRPAGVIVAYLEDRISGISTITALRNFSGDNKWALVYNYGQSDERVLVEKNSSIFSDPATMNWGNSNTLIRANRIGNIITCTTSQFNNGIIDPTTTLDFDLEDDPDTTKFLSGSDYGLTSGLNPGLEFIIESMSFEYDYFVDITENLVYVRGINASEYEVDRARAQDFMSPRVLYRSLVNGLYYFIREHGTYERISRRHDGVKVEADLAAGASIVLTPSPRDYSSMLDFNPNPFVVESGTSYVRSSDIEVKYNPQAGTVTLTNNSSTTKKVSYTRPAEYGV